MKIGNNGLDILTLSMLRSNRNHLPTSNKANGNGRQAQIQPQRCLAAAMGFTPPPATAFGRNHNADGNLSTGLSAEALADRAFMSNPVNYAKTFLHGRNGEEGIGVQALRQILSEKGVELPDDIRFDIGLNRYGRVTISGLEDAELTRRIEEAMSYDSRLINSVLGVFVRSARVLEGVDVGNSNAFSPQQTRLFQIQSDLMNYGVGLHDLSLDVNGRIQGLPQELYDRIYGDRSEWLSGMEEMEARWENWNIDRIRDDIIHFLRSGTAHIPTPDLSLTFDNGRVLVNAGSVFNQNNGGFNVTI